MDIGCYVETYKIFSLMLKSQSCKFCFDFSWSQLPLGRQLARLSCAAYEDHFYMISNNATSVFRYDPATATLEEWKELNEVNVEFAGELMLIILLCFE